MLGRTVQPGEYPGTPRVGIDNIVVNGNIGFCRLFPCLTPPERRPYHHGNLRTDLLDAAERRLKVHGVEQLSLRDLARDVGVSHAAPRRHFADRRALLDALAESGFMRLGAKLRAAVNEIDDKDDLPARLQAFAWAYVQFATENAELTGLMNSRKHRPGRPRSPRPPQPRSARSAT